MLRKDGHNLLSYHLLSQKHHPPQLDPLIGWNLPMSGRRLLVSNWLKWEVQPVLSKLFLWSHWSDSIQEHHTVTGCSSTQHQPLVLAGKPGLASQPHPRLLPRNNTKLVGNYVGGQKTKAVSGHCHNPNGTVASNYLCVTGHMQYPGVLMPWKVQ